MKVKKFFVTACAVAVAGVTAFSVFGSDAVYGDITGDGVVNTKDLTRLMKHLAGSEVEVYGADLTGDGEISAKDLTRLMKVMAGDYETTLPVDTESGSSTESTPVDTEPIETEPIETESAPETIPSEPEEDYDLAATDLGEIFSSASSSGVITDMNADDLINNAFAKTSEVLESDVTVTKTYKAKNGIEYTYKGRGKSIIDNETYEFKGAKINEYINRDDVESTSLTYFDGQYCYINTSEDEDPYYIVGLNSMYTAMDTLLPYHHITVDNSLMMGTEVKELAEGGYYIRARFNYSDVEYLVNQYIEELMAEYDPLESPVGIHDIEIEYIIDENGMLTSSRLKFTFGITFRVDASNTRALTIDFEYAINYNDIGEHVPIERPEGLEDYWMYDATEEILADLEMLHDDADNRVANFDFLYNLICENYTREEVEAVIDAYGIVL